MQKKNYHIAIDGLRVLAIFAVLTIHVSTRTIEASHGNIASLPFSFLINQASRFAVPLFFMISGYVLELNYHLHESFFTYLKKRFNRIFLPYVFWSAIYFLFVYHDADTFGKALTTGSASYQLYFIPTLLIFYFIFPLLHKLYRVLSNKFVFFGLLGLQVFLIVRDYYFHPLPIFYPIDIALLNYFVFIAGMVASHHQKPMLIFVKKYLVILLLATVGVVISIFYEGRSLYLASHNYLDYYSSWRPLILLYTFLLGAVFYYLIENSQKITSITQLLSKLSFFVFFIHVAILEVFWSLVFKQLFMTATHTIPGEIAFDLLFLTLVTVTSYALAYLVHKIPFVTKVTG